MLAPLTLGSIFIGWNFYLPSRNKLKNSDHQQATKCIALTFDDGPAGYTVPILDILKQENVPAAFFLIGKNIKGNEETIRRILAEGHTAGNHSFNHGFNFDWQSAAKMQEELQQTNAAIEAISGSPVTLFRPPYGVTNPNLAKAIRNSRMQSIGWSLRSMDTVAKDKNQLLDKILAKVQPGDIILLHDRCAVTAAVLPELITALKKRGFSFATL